MPVLLPLVPRPSDPAGTFPAEADRCLRLVPRRPPAFTSTARDEQAIPAGSTVLIYPYSTAGYLNSLMAFWQAMSGERFPPDGRRRDDPAGPGGGGGSDSPPLSPPPSSSPPHLGDTAFPVRPSTPWGRSTSDQLVADQATIRRYGFGSVVVADRVGATTRQEGRCCNDRASSASSPVAVGGVYVWYGCSRISTTPTRRA